MCRVIALPLPQDSGDESYLAEFERALLIRLRTGNRAAFEELVRHYGARMLAVIRRFLCDDHDCQDALQDAFLSAYRAVKRFKGESQLGTWLHRVAVNAALMRIRAKKRRQECSLDELSASFSSEGKRREAPDRWTTSPDIEADHLETRELVRHGIARLPERYRAILVLRDIEQRSTEETAQLLDLTPVNVKTRLHRARAALKELLEPQFAS